MFVISDRYNRRKRAGLDAGEHTEKFFVEKRNDLKREHINLPDFEEGDTVLLVPIRDPNNLAHLRMALEQSHDTRSEVVVMTVKVDRNYKDNQKHHDDPNLLTERGNTVLSDDEKHLFTRVVELAETYGEQIVPLVVPSNNAWYAIAKTAHDVKANEILLGWSGRINADIQLEQLTLMWSMVSDETTGKIKLRIISRDGEEVSAER